MARGVFDADDLDAAFEELDARYLAGEAATYAHTWSAIMSANAAFNRREMFATTADWVNIDHRRLTGFTPDDQEAYVRATWDLAPDVKNRIVAVHRMSYVGAVFTQALSATSRESFEAEWRDVVLLTFRGDSMSRCEVFEESDLDAALARFDELNRQLPQLENAATRQNARLAVAFNRRDLEGILGTVATDAHYDDRRKGLRYEGPMNAEFVHGLLYDESESWRLEVESIAIRGDRLALSRHTYRDAADPDRPIAVEAINLTEVGDNGLARNSIVFDTDDVDAAFAELDARYVAGEAAAHSDAWMAITRSFAVFNNHELPSTAIEWIDHRRLVGSGPSDLAETTQAAWDMTQNICSRIESVHRLNDRGAVITQSLKGMSNQGFDFEWRVIDVFTIEGDAISRCEMFDEADLDAALTRFDELNAPVLLLENTATRQSTQIADAYNRRGQDDFLAAFSANAQYDDRRKLLRNNGDVDSMYVHELLSAPAATWRVKFNPVAIRGDRSALNHFALFDADEADQAVVLELLAVTEVDSDGSIIKLLLFDTDDLDDAFAELDSRFAASEAVPHAHTWSLVTKTYTGFNRRELFGPAPNWESVDHRRGITSAPFDALDYVDASWDVTPDVKAYVQKRAPTE